MEERNDNPSVSLTSQLARLGMMRLEMEIKQQILLSKSIYLSRFIKIAALEKAKDFPEIEGAKKVLNETFTYFKVKSGLSTFQGHQPSLFQSGFKVNLN
jgi:hypothetical protein